MFTDESTRERLILRFDNDALAEPLPELRLGSPKLLLIPANDEGRMLSLFFTFLFAHCKLLVQANRCSHLLWDEPDWRNHIGKPLTRGSDTNCERLITAQLRLTLLPPTAVRSILRVA